jgi:protein NRD1
MVSRKDAVNAKESMANNRDVDSSLRTRWGVGFGPRDCSDYTTGVSVIPISKLTDADRKWMLTAEYGGSGGKPIESGMVVEEPDIEIGAGVSSKAISRRMGTDRPAHGGRESMDRDDEHGRRGRRDDGNSFQNRNQNRDQNNPNNIAIPQNPNNPPPIHLGNGRMPPLPPGFPAFPMVPGAGAAGMPFFPPGFAYPAQTTPAQPPPPGRG